MFDNELLITGGNGMVGKHLREQFPSAVFVTKDNFGEEFDLTNPVHVEYMISANRPQRIIHAAGKVGGIMDNMMHPADFFDQNILMNTLMVKYAHKYNVERFTGILSTCIYPDVMDKYPMVETDLHLGPPAETNFSYGYAKRCMAVQIDAYNQQYKTNYNYVIPSNLYSEYDVIYGRNANKPHFVTALLSKIQRAEEYGDKTIKLMGTGKPLRQFMYAGDLARVLGDMVEYDITESFNVAPVGQNFSIDELARMTLLALGHEDWDIWYDSTYPDGQYRKDVSINKMVNLIPNFEFTHFVNGIQKVYNILYRGDKNV